MLVALSTSVRLNMSVQEAIAIVPGIEVSYVLNEVCHHIIGKTRKISLV